MKKGIAVLVAAGILLFAFTGCTKKTAPVVINSVADLEGKKIGCQAGTTGESYVQENLKTAVLKSFKNGIDAALALKNGSIDAIVIDELPASEIIKRNPELSIIDDEFASEEYAIAVKKGNTELLEAINKTIVLSKADGTYDSLLNAFIPVDGNIIIPDIPLINSDEVLKMGTNAAFPPFEYIEGTDAAGFDISLSRLIAIELNKKLVVIDMNFDGLIPALQSGAVDFVAAGMTNTEERRKNVDFSDPYYRSKQVIIIKK